MKSITIEVPGEGTSIQLVFRGEVPPAQAVLVIPDDVEIRYGTPAVKAEAVGAPATAAPLATTNAKPAEKSPLDLDAIAASLLKMRPKRRTMAVDIITTMFQFTNPVSVETANRILQDLSKRGDLSLTPGGGVDYPNQKKAQVVQGH